MKHALAKYIAGLLLFGSNGVVAGFIDLPSHDIVLLRSLLGGILLVAILLAREGTAALRGAPRDAFFVCLSGVAMAADWLLLFEAYARIGVSLGMIVNYCGPVLVVLLSALVLRERITARTALALAMALAGAVLISWQGVRGGVDRTGLALAVLSAFAYAAMIVLNKLSVTMTGTRNAALQLLATLAVVAIYVGARHGLRPSVPPGSWLPVLWIGLANTGLGCCFYFSAVSALPAQTVAVCGYLEPLSAVVFAMLVLGERMLPMQIAGALLILAGSLLLRKKSH